MIGSQKKTESDGIKLRLPQGQGCLFDVVVGTPKNFGIAGEYYSKSSQRRPIWEDKDPSGSKKEEISDGKRRSSVEQKYSNRIVKKDLLPPRISRKSVSQQSLKEHDPKESFIFRSPEVDNIKKKSAMGFHATSVKNEKLIVDGEVLTHGPVPKRGHLYQLNSCHKLFHQSCSRFRGGDLKSSMHKQQVLLQQKSLKLEDELYQSQTNFRKQEGTYTKKIAVLEQQLHQASIEMSESRRRQEKQKEIYSKILQIINQQMLSSKEQDDQSASIIMSHIQAIIEDANQVFGPQPQQCEAGEQSETLVLQIKEKVEIIQTLEVQTKKLISENLDLTQKLHQRTSELQSAKEAKEGLEKACQKLEKSLHEQKEREASLKELHSDEMKYMTDINLHEKKLMESRIKELESLSTHLQKQIERICPFTKELLSPESLGKPNSLTRRHYSNPGRQVLPSSRFSLSGISNRVSLFSNALRQHPTVEKHSQNQNAQEVLQVKQQTTEIIAIQQHQEININQEINIANYATRQSKPDGSKLPFQTKAIQTEDWLNQSMMFDLTSNHEVLQTQLQHAQGEAQTQQMENDKLRKQIMEIKDQISRLEQLQLSTQQRSASKFRASESKQKLDIKVKKFQIKLLEDEEKPRDSKIEARKKQQTIVPKTEKNVESTGKKSEKKEITRDFKSQQAQVRSRSRRSRIQSRNRVCHGVINLAKYLSQTQRSFVESAQDFDDEENDVEAESKPHLKVEGPNSRLNYSDRKRRMRANLTSRSNSNQPEGNLFFRAKDRPRAEKILKKDNLLSKSVGQWREMVQFSSKYLNFRQELMESTQPVAQKVYESIQIKKSPQSKGKSTGLDKSLMTMQPQMQTFTQHSPGHQSLEPHYKDTIGYDVEDSIKLDFKQQFQFEQQALTRAQDLTEDDGNIDSSVQISPIKQEAGKARINDMKNKSPGLHNRWIMDKCSEIKVVNQQTSDHLKQSEDLQRTLVFRNKEIENLRIQLKDIQTAYESVQAKYLESKELIKVLLEQNERFETRVKQAQNLLNDNMWYIPQEMTLALDPKKKEAKNSEMGIKVVSFDLNEQVSSSVKNLNILEMTSARKEAYDNAKRDAYDLIQNKPVSSFNLEATDLRTGETDHEKLLPKVTKIDLMPLNTYKNSCINQFEVRQHPQRQNYEEEVQKVPNQFTQRVKSLGTSQVIEKTLHSQKLQTGSKGIFEKRRISTAMSLSNLPTARAVAKEQPQVKELFKKIEDIGQRQQITKVKLLETKQMCNKSASVKHLGMNIERKAPRLMINLEDDTSSQEAIEQHPQAVSYKVSPNTKLCVTQKREDEYKPAGDSGAKFTIPTQYEQSSQRITESRSPTSLKTLPQPFRSSMQVTRAQETSSQATVPFKKRIVDNKIVLEPDPNQVSPAKPTDDPKEKFRHYKSYKRYENQQEEEPSESKPQAREPSNNRNLKGTLLKLIGTEAPHIDTKGHKPSFMEENDTPNLVETFQSDKDEQNCMKESLQDLERLLRGSDQTVAGPRKVNEDFHQYSDEDKRNEGDITPEKLRDKFLDQTYEPDVTSSLPFNQFNNPGHHKQFGSLYSLRTINERGETNLRESSRLESEQTEGFVEGPARVSSPHLLRDFQVRGKYETKRKQAEKTIQELSMNKTEIVEEISPDKTIIPLVEEVDNRGDWSISQVIQADIKQQLSTHTSDPSAVGPFPIHEFKSSSVNQKISNHQLPPTFNTKLSEPIINIDQLEDKINYYQTNQTSKHQSARSSPMKMSDGPYSRPEQTTTSFASSTKPQNLYKMKSGIQNQFTSAATPKGLLSMAGTKVQKIVPFKHQPKVKTIEVKKQQPKPVASSKIAKKMISATQVYPQLLKRQRELSGAPPQKKPTPLQIEKKVDQKQEQIMSAREKMTVKTSLQEAFSSLEIKQRQFKSRQVKQGALTSRGSQGISMQSISRNLQSALQINFGTEAKIQTNIVNLYESSRLEKCQSELTLLKQHRDLSRSKERGKSPAYRTISQKRSPLQTQVISQNFGPEVKKVTCQAGKMRATIDL